MLFVYDGLPLSAAVGRHMLPDIERYCICGATQTELTSDSHIERERGGEMRQGTLLRLISGQQQPEADSSAGLWPGRFYLNSLTRLQLYFSYSENGEDTDGRTDGRTDRRKERRRESYEHYVYLTTAGEENSGFINTEQH